MNMKVTNKKIDVGDFSFGGVSQSSIVLIGDTDVLSCYSIFDTPPHAVVYSPQVPLQPLGLGLRRG
ncbi:MULTISPECIES: hypothetical protein [Brevibacillus]|uniref:hypothetical protein n=1 Tax=Brevibacillus TaxID=55080 RepID=UPI000D10FC28|nr:MULTISPECIES: hypothetical protein [Brevibacillus]PSJ70045.1 hypothetical protein C7J99_05660 [Brevibacillus brevis]RED29911.1 spore germination protein PD [Brevibacillus brevis]TQK74726.1 spore germination protein PD [Brevibacillus sp. AG162]VEF88460.1 Probable spore germination protein gerPD [Brevibacillus brevis]GEC90003.1 putative spore germination protein GerPD [Brevibacillus brevis]